MGVAKKMSSGCVSAFIGKICIVLVHWGHCSEFRGFKGQSLLGGYNYISSMWLSVGDESLGHSLFRGGLLLGGGRGC